MLALLAKIRRCGQGAITLWYCRRHTRYDWGLCNSALAGPFHLHKRGVAMDVHTCYIYHGEDYFFNASAACCPTLDPYTTVMSAAS